ncbi:kinesin-like protein KIFC3 isoform X2 [Brienomyrus brachyistius]|uniref:kinesin-like protein KIFC3 isoform X2 n=1 Tax=Brienomyrus brachyistius TaxID=42636 RepID=UPI0020B37661|nr:kinesin-like protein KIFC3 isoform X2 [Brienomyrus brachyistius]
MYVLCTMMALCIRSLLRRYRAVPSPGDRHGVDEPGGSGELQLVWRVGVRHKPPSPVMLGARRTWDFDHTPCLQELWKRDVSFDDSSLDLLMSDGEEDTSFLPLQTSAFPRRLLTSELPNPSNQQLLIQDKVSEIQARLCREDVGWGCLSHGPQSQDLWTPKQECRASQCEVAPSGGGGSSQGPSELHPAEQGLEEGSDTQNLSHVKDPGQQALISRLHAQVGLLEEKLLDQTQEVERLRAGLGATDLEKQLEVLVLENERLKQELRECQDLEALRRQLAQRDEEVREQQQQLRELQRQLNQEAARATQLEQVLQERETEPQPSQRLRAPSRQTTLPPQAKYLAGVGEMDFPRHKQTLHEAQNQVLQEQLVVQQDLFLELQQQLHESQRVSSQLRAQVLTYEGEIERCQGQLEVEMQILEEEKNRVIEEAFVRAESEMKAVHQNLAGVRMNLLTLQPALRTLTCDYNCLKRQVQDFPFMLEKAIAEAKQEICHVIREVSSTNRELLRKYKREMNLRKRCHDELVRLRGNIRVFCRVRPVGQEATSSGSRSVVTFDPDDDALLHLASKGKLMTFELDKVFPPQTTQEEVFQEVQSLITSCIDGYNVCIFAYGQTGAGKTYTMEGVADNPGINQRALQLLFSEVSEKAPDWEFRITVSMVEIYNETLRNLLGDNPSEKLEIKMCPDGSGQLYVPGLTEISVQSVEDINRVFSLGYVNRATACTNLNEHSSRSHALLIVTVAGVNATTGHRTSGKLNLVDLAGSERISRSGAEGSRLREAQCINKSLAALGDVIHALRSRQPHVPFRNSRLTYLLQDSLNGDSKTLMMVQVSPLDNNMSESVCSLKFAQRVRSVELGPVSATRRPADCSPNSASPTHDSVELDSPPVTPVPLPISRISSSGSISALSGARRKSQSHLSSGRMKLAAS